MYCNVHVYSMQYVLLNNIMRTYILLKSFIVMTLRHIYN